MKLFELIFKFLILLSYLKSSEINQDNDKNSKSLFETFKISKNHKVLKHNICNPYIYNTNDQEIQLKNKYDVPDFPEENLCEVLKNYSLTLKPKFSSYNKKIFKEKLKLVRKSIEKIPENEKN